MNKLIVLTLLVFPGLLFSAGVTALEVTVTVKGSSWDSDSRGFANIQGLSVTAGTEKAARRGSRISVDGRPEIFAISGEGGAFELSLTGVDVYDSWRKPDGVQFEVDNRADNNPHPRSGPGYQQYRRIRGSSIHPL